MKESRQILPGITSVRYFDGYTLPSRIDLRAIVGERIYVNPDETTELDIACQDASCECKRERHDTTWRDTAKLKFRSTTEIPMMENIAFLVSDAAGSVWIIGSREHPRPIVEMSVSSGTAKGDTAGYEYSVSHTAIRTLIQSIS